MEKPETICRRVAPGLVTAFSARQTSGQAGNGVQHKGGFPIVPKNILVPLTLSRGSSAALTVARNLASESNTTVVLLHVVQLNIAGEEHGIQRARLVGELCQDAELKLHELAAGLGGETRIEILVCEGSPANTIVETARRLKSETIVMQTSGDRGWLKSWLPNTALIVARQAPCGVLLVAPETGNDTINLLLVDHANINRKSNRAVSHGTQNPFRSMLRVLFSCCRYPSPSGGGGGKSRRR